MNENRFHADGKKLKAVAPVYLGIQAATLLLTFLDSPVYLEAYQLHGNLSIGGWAVGWLALTGFGLVAGLLLLFGKGWRAVFEPAERIKLAGGYLAGAVAGLLALGLRFMPLMPPEYFFAVGGLAVAMALAYLIWVRRRARVDEIFP